MKIILLLLLFSFLGTDGRAGMGYIFHLSLGSLGSLGFLGVLGLTLVDGGMDGWMDV